MRALLKHFVAFPPVESLQVGGNILVDDLLATVPAYEAACAAHLFKLPLQCTCYLPQFYEVATVRQLVEIER
jgi:hypothetical protein